MHVGSMSAIAVMLLLLFGFAGVGGSVFDWRADRGEVMGYQPLVPLLLRHDRREGPGSFGGPWRIHRPSFLSGSAYVGALLSMEWAPHGFRRWGTALSRQATMSIRDCVENPRVLAWHPQGRGVFLHPPRSFLAFGGRHRP